MLPRSRRARRGLGAALAATVVLATAAIGLTALVNARSYQLFGELTARVETTAKVVALTFDDGPDPAGTGPLLETLAHAGVPATFYLMGSDIAAHPDLAAAITAAGHEIGNHTYHHDRMVLVSPSFVADELERTDALIRQAGYRGDITFRPPNGKKLLTLPFYLAQHHRRTIMWDVEPNSYPEVDASAERIADHVVDHVRPGSIVLLHGMYAGREQTRKAVGPIIERLTGAGYRFVTVSELLTFAGH
jgi:peptidoglycan/xylan/chitin deacetylase (PgdA/CDA1 family)